MGSMRFTCTERKGEERTDYHCVMKWMNFSLKWPIGSTGGSWKEEFKEIQEINQAGMVNLRLNWEGETVVVKKMYLLKKGSWKTPPMELIHHTSGLLRLV